METEAEACETESKQTQYRKEFSQADNSEAANKRRGCRAAGRVRKKAGRY